MREVVFRLGFDVKGVVITTSDLVEQQPAKALLPKVWQFYYDLFYPQTEGGTTSYAVYSYPDPAEPSYYQVCIGSAVPLKANIHNHVLKNCRVGSGRYLVFSGNGSYPELVRSLWDEVALYFAQPACLYRRAFITDFEELLPTGQLNLALSVEMLD